MKTQINKLYELKFDKIIEEMRVNDKFSEILEETEKNYGTLTSQLFDELTGPTVDAFLDFGYRRRKDIPKIIADKFIKLWFCLPNSIVYPYQDHGPTINIMFLDDKGKDVSDVAFESVTPGQIKYHFPLHVSDFINLLNQVGIEQAQKSIKDKVTRFNDNVIIQAVRTEKLSLQGYSNEQICEILGISEWKVKSMITHLNERKNPLPYWNIINRERIRKTNLKEEIDNLKVPTLSKTFEIFTAVIDDQMDPDKAVKSLQNLWLVKELLLSNN
jgi:hypothetical protein